MFFRWRGVFAGGFCWGISSISVLTSPKTKRETPFLLGVFLIAVFAWGVFAWVFLRIDRVFLRISADFF